MGCAHQKGVLCDIPMCVCVCVCDCLRRDVEPGPSPSSSAPPPGRARNDRAAGMAAVDIWVGNIPFWVDASGLTAEVAAHGIAIVECLLKRREGNQDTLFL